MLSFCVRVLKWPPQVFTGVCMVRNESSAGVLYTQKFSVREVALFFLPHELVTFAVAVITYSDKKNGLRSSLQSIMAEKLRTSSVASVDRSRETDANSVPFSPWM